MYGPFYKKSGNNIWHWVKSCPEFPKSDNVQAMVSSKKPDAECLCEECAKIELDGFKEGIDSDKA